MSIYYSDIIGHKKVIDYFKDTKKIQHTLLSGSPGIGKTTILHAFLCENGYQRSSELHLTEEFTDVLELNSANDRSYHVVMNKIRNFIRLSTDKKFKILIMEEMDTLMNLTQAGLSLILDPNVCPANFLLLATCNNPDSIKPFLLSHFKIFKMHTPNYNLSISLLEKIARKKCINISREQLHSLYHKSNQDIRNAIRWLESNMYLYSTINPYNELWGEIKKQSPDKYKIINIIEKSGISPRIVVQMMEKIYIQDTTKYIKFIQIAETYIHRSSIQLIDVLYHLS